MRISADPDQCGSGSVRIRIRNTALKAQFLMQWLAYWRIRFAIDVDILSTGTSPPKETNSKNQIQSNLGTIGILLELQKLSF